MTDDKLAYAREVWAACATLGFDDAEVRRLKAGLDGLGDTAPLGEIDRLVALAEKVQRDSVTWATGQRPYNDQCASSQFAAALAST